ncbi:MAG: Mobile element protein [uncultured Corynebacteriales bacterium]|uniref:Mobile element protein n=1 Tax=uncultured Mycobacteriales bacterium TaxID=581187 RepID=A0A6J4ICF7_9ACTN|nr:MAG: Mobile element protein [uncultured Corynebacteriales bacterium]
MVANGADGVVAGRAVPGHWESDLVFGRGMSPVVTLVERSTRYLMLVGLPDGHRAELVADALVAAITTLPRQPTRSLGFTTPSEALNEALR